MSIYLVRFTPLEPYFFGNEKTFGYGTVKKICKIDYIFSDRPAVKDTLVLHKDSSNGIFLSDHYPVSVDVNI